MQIERLEDFDDPRIRNYRNVRDRTLRGERIFMAEGLLVTRRLLTSRFDVESILTSEAFLPRIQDVLADDIPVYVAPTVLLRRVVGYAFHLGIMAIGRRPSRAESLADVVEAQLASPTPGRRYVWAVLPERTTPDNLGLVCRNVAALGCAGLLVGQDSCDLYCRRTLRLSMGAILHIRLVRSTDLAADLAMLHERYGLARYATVLDADATPLDRVGWGDRVAILFGNEYDGIGTAWRDRCDQRITIPMDPCVDSLNVAVASGIFLHEAMRARSH